jgi:hypothetical protein
MLMMRHPDESDDLGEWISGLRGRVARGELVGSGPGDPDGGEQLSTEQTVRIMLADLDHLDYLTCRSACGLDVPERRRRLLGDLRRLRDRIG